MYLFSPPPFLSHFSLLILLPFLLPLSFSRPPSHLSNPLCPFNIYFLASALCPPPPRIACVSSFVLSKSFFLTLLSTPPPLSLPSFILLFVSFPTFTFPPPPPLLLSTFLSQLTWKRVLVSWSSASRRRESRPGCRCCCWHRHRRRFSS